MKPRKIIKKLRLNKKTIANLKKREMNGVYGAAKCNSETNTTCNPCNFIESYCGGVVTLCPTITGNPDSKPCCEDC